MRFFNTPAISKFIESFEDQHKETLLKDELNGWKTWSLLRKKIYFLYKRGSTHKKSRQHLIRRIGKKLVSSLYLLSFLPRLIVLRLSRTNPTIIITYPINLLDKNASGKRIDVYLFGFLNRTDISKIHLSKGRFSIRSNLLFKPDLFITDASRFYLNVLPSSHKKQIHQQSDKFSNLLNSFAEKKGIDNRIDALWLKDILNNFLKEEKFLPWPVPFLKPQRIIVQDQVGGPLMAAANKLSVPIYEVQHGFFHHNKPDYFFGDFFLPYKDLMPLPTKILTIGEFFNETLLRAGFWKDQDVQSIGSYKIDKYRNFTSRNRVHTNELRSSIILILQPSCVEQWQILLSELAKADATSYQFYLKPHPNESHANCEWYEKISAENENFTYLNKSVNLMQLIVEGDIVVGFHSTALFESLSLGKEVIAMSMQNYGHTLKDLVVVDISKYFHFVKSELDLLTKIDELIKKQQTEKYNELGNLIAKPGYERNIAKFLTSDE